MKEPAMRSSKDLLAVLFAAAALAASGCAMFKKCPGSASCPVQPQDPHLAGSTGFR
jgi:hypothetical protein